MSQPDPPPVTIPPPPPVKVAGLIVALEGAALLALAVGTVISGSSTAAPMSRVIAQTAYYVVLALCLAAVASALIKGRRWGRSPALVVQIVTTAIGFWMAVPSGKVAWGLAMILAGVVAGYLLLTPAANTWISLFPHPLGEEQDR